MTVTAGIVALVGLLATGYFTTSMYRRRAEPTARPLLGVAIVMFVGVLAVASIVHLDSMGELATLFTGLDDGQWVVAAFVYPLIAMGLWVAFAFQYTGHGDRITLGVVVLVGVLALLITGPLFVDSVVGFEPALQIANFSTFVGLFVVSALSIVSLFVIVDESLRLRGYGLGEPVVFSGAVLALLFAPLVPTVTRDPVSFPGLLATSALLFTFAVARFSTFETLPVARVVARDRLIGELDDAILVVDREQCVRDLNPAAEAHFGIERSAALETDLAELFPVDLVPGEVADAAGPKTFQTPSGTELAVTANRVTDNRDRLFGYLLVCRDVTDRQDRERRLSVLNQLLVGAVRERMERVAERSARLTGDGPTEVESAVESTAAPAEYASEVSVVAADIWTTTTELASLVAHARDVERALANPSDEPTDVTETVVEVLERAGVEPAVEAPGAAVPAAFPETLLRAVLQTLLVDALDAAAVDVLVTDSEAGPEIHLVAEGADLAAEVEAQSASGLAIEIAGLAAEHAGGVLAVSDTPPDRIVLELPDDRPGTTTDSRSVVRSNRGRRES